MNRHFSAEPSILIGWLVPVDGSKPRIVHWGLRDTRHADIRHPRRPLPDLSPREGKSC